MNYWLILIPLISAFIGWFTNWIAIKMLFHPREPKKILGLTFQGIFPKRQQQFAEKLGKLVSTELLSFSDIEEKITSPQNVEKLMPFVEAKVDEFLRVKLNDAFPIISMFIGENTIQQLKGIFMQELQVIFPEVINKHVKQLQSQLDLEKIISEKVAGFSSDKLEQILNQIMSKEFRFVEIIGGILGFIIGLLQILLTTITA
ncbi:membrane protein [Bacteroidota bacterium]|nr:membrane protein [Bacteroidota bacterium]